MHLISKDGTAPLQIWNQYQPVENFIFGPTIRHVPYNFFKMSVLKVKTNLDMYPYTSIFLTNLSF